MTATQSESRSVVITGAGVVSPLASSAGECAARVCAGETCLGPLPGGVGAMLDEIPLEAVPEQAQPRTGRLDRLCKLFLTASFRAMADASLAAASVEPERLGLSFGTGLGCLLTNAEFYEKVVASGPAAASPRSFAYTVSNAAAGEVSIALGIKGPNLTSHAGFAAGAEAIAYASEIIRRGRADVMLAGGADALGSVILDGLAAMQLLRTRAGVPFGDPQAGINPSEAAAVLVLEEEQRAVRRGAPVLARIVGYGLGSEPTLTTARPLTLGVEASLRRGLDAAGAGASDVDVVLTSAHGTSLDAVELAALRAVLGEARPLLLAPKRAWGECLAASGALAVASAAAMLNSHPTVAAGAGYDLLGRASAAPVASASSRLAVVHTLCYSGPVVALLLTKAPPE